MILLNPLRIFTHTSTQNGPYTAFKPTTAVLVLRRGIDLLGAPARRYRNER